MDAELKVDFEGTLGRLARLGYQQVELAGMHGRTADQVRRALDRAGLQCVSTHVMAQRLGTGTNLTDNLDQVIADTHALGAGNVVMPLFLLPLKFQPPVVKDPFDFVRAAGKSLTLDDYRRTADFLNDKGAQLKRQGLQLGYHNHNFEFAPLDGSSGFETLMSRTDPNIVHFELDIGWVMAAGVDPRQLILNHRGRITQAHVKDIKATTKINFDLRQDPVDVGGGMISWQTILPTAYDAGIRQFFVEQEPPFSGSAMDALGRSALFLSHLSG